MCIIGFVSISVYKSLSGGVGGDEAVTLGLFTLRVLLLGVTVSDILISGSNG